MSEPGPVTVQRVDEIVLANRAIRAPFYEAHHDEGVRFTDPKKRLQWGADVIPALMCLFRVERDTRGDHPDGWVGFARHWRGGTLRLDFDLKPGPEETDSILVVTAISGREGKHSILDEDFGEIELPDHVPTRQEWEKRSKRYQAARRADTSDGAAAVTAYIEALPAWKRALATRIDEIIRREVPHVRSAVKWHTPFYAVEGQGWIVSFSALSKKLKLTFMSGTSLNPVPPGGNKQDARWLDLSEGDPLDEELLSSWIRQAAVIPGWVT